MDVIYGREWKETFNKKSLQFVFSDIASIQQTDLRLKLKTKTHPLQPTKEPF